MTESLVPRPGAVFSADIAVPEHGREVRFYSRVLATGERPLWRDDLMNNLGIPVIGLGERTADYATLPLQWMPHIQVNDVAASVRRALELGGSELMHARDARGSSEWAVLLDPNAAAFGLIPVVPAEHVPEAASVPSREGAGMGRIAWLDLTVADAVAAREFYRAVVGWGAEQVEMKDGSERYADFNMVDEGGIPMAGICHARGANAELPPVWMIYLPVGDLEESTRRVREEGGRVIAEVTGSDGATVYAAIEDPVGACLALVQG
jgi:uncharacterized protein